MSVARVAGPDFLAFVVEDVEGAATFWTDVIGLKPSPHGPPGAKVFETSPIPFAIRSPRPGEPVGSGQGVAVWFAVSGDVDECRAALLQRGGEPDEVHDGPFGRMFTLPAPGGFTVTVHAAAP